ncbi:hypothetical protein DOK78_002000 [Enterococcus sp. DIV2402]|uniref:Tyr recombinase domain-containing protein n=1 Tax=Candidatus Enterococcus lowellii TaxID=2230877 RepID=A0ABZ2SPA3_9ENTE|nr:hypothetical protein [Enterococcus sp. DIV2402]MBO0463869.1 hypothetical protein [Enterococcus sp. DIV2402]
MIMLLADTGIRLAELRNLRDDNFSKNSILSKTVRAERTELFFVSPIILKQKLKYDRAKSNYFEEWNEYQQSNFVFLGQRGKKLSADMVVQRDTRRLWKLRKQ